MQFIFIRKIGLGPTGQPKANVSLVGDTKESMISIEECAREIITLKDPKETNVDSLVSKEKENIVKEMSLLEVDGEFPVYDKDNKIVSILIKVSDKYDFVTFFKEWGNV